MRRFLSLLLLAAFGLPVVAPALALGQDAEAHLPACCRRHGIHHCAMSMASAAAPAFGTRCPSYPPPSAVAPAANHAALVLTPAVDAAYLFTLAATQQAETQRRVSRERSRHKRGPHQDLL